MKTPKAPKPPAAQPTAELFAAYRAQFVYLNRTLFGGELPECVLNFSRHARSYGFFAPGRWRHVEGTRTTHELSLNPDYLATRTPREVASTFVHELCHLWQEVCGKPPRRCYHDWEFARKMESVGLMTSTTGAPGGKRVGQSMTHYIIEGGPFDVAFQNMPADCQLPWRALGVPTATPKTRKGGTEADGEGDGEQGSVPTAGKKDASKTPYQCTCSRMWGKPGLDATCNLCGDDFKPVE